MKRQQQKGFTIIELLIVITIIAVLAAITIVSYSTVTAKANLSAAQASANQVVKKAETFKNESTTLGSTTYYPATLSVLTGATSDKAYQVTGVSYSALGSATTTGVRYDLCGVTNATTAATTYSGATGIGGASALGQFITGAKVYYWDYNTQAITTSPLTVGQVSGTYPGGTAAVACFAAGS